MIGLMARSLDGRDKPGHEGDVWLEYRQIKSLMRGLDPRIQIPSSEFAILDGRDKPGHEGF